jgi:hypothetical protein
MDHARSIINDTRISIRKMRREVFRVPVCLADASGLS